MGQGPLLRPGPKPISLVRNWKIDNLNLLREQQLTNKNKNGGNQ